MFQQQNSSQTEKVKEKKKTTTVSFKQVPSHNVRKCKLQKHMRFSENKLVITRNWKPTTAVPPSPSPPDPAHSFWGGHGGKSSFKHSPISLSSKHLGSMAEWWAALCWLDTGHLKENDPGSCPNEAYSPWKFPRGKRAMTVQGQWQCREIQGLGDQRRENTFLDKRHLS